MNANYVVSVIISSVNSFVDSGCKDKNTCARTNVIRLNACADASDQTANLHRRHYVATGACDLKCDKYRFQSDCFGDRLVDCRYVGRPNRAIKLNVSDAVL